MSGRLVSAVFASGLPAWLKPYASALATYAQEKRDLRVWPAVRTLARDVGRSERRTMAAIAALRAAGVLELERAHGPGRPNRYRFNPSALPARRTTFAGQLELFDAAERKSAQANRKKHSMIARFPQFPQAYTGRVRQAKPDAGVTRSVLNREFSTRTGGARKKRAYGR